jgi:hypothetical protein
MEVTGEALAIGMENSTLNVGDSDDVIAFLNLPILCSYFDLTSKIVTFSGTFLINTPHIKY